MVIVAGVDRSDRAKEVAEEAAELSLAFGDPLHIVHVMSSSEFVDLQLETTERTGRPVEMENVRDMATEFAEDAGEGLEVDFESAGLVGDASREVVRYATDQNARYVVVGGRKRSPAGKVIFGSVAQSILLNSNRPVLVVIQGD